MKLTSGKFDETPKREHTQTEMIDVMTQELINLPRFTAYAKVIEEKGGGQAITKSKIKTLSLSRLREEWDKFIEFRKQRIEAYTNDSGCVRRRDEIEEEIKQRLEKWRKGRSDEPPPTHY